ncbi:hypothetical protein NEPAR07_0904 [Nematocida parisii]|uniref:Thioredoxin domain-containing protein n=1 Tax=Nematocida parisii (strain ERTm3) TaxID=935791 RepID=I3EDK9_NEMP3|nr:hypothetical protein NEQG_02429 [Nematocida parisii ERTm3]KAI5143855.1 hypothetical protein NEPAR07_0904 [Nematocida parisii]
MNISIFFVFLLLIQNSKETFTEIQTYTVEDFNSNTPTLIFIYYNTKESTCFSCESYKKWLESFEDYKVGVFSIKRLNFSDDPILALRFKATSFPTFFLQHKKRFKNITSIDILDHNLSYDKKYHNDIDAILKNPRILDRIETLEGLKAPSSVLMLVYAYAFTCLMTVINILDRISEIASFKFVITTLSITLSVSVLIRLINRRHANIKLCNAQKCK